ncbi:MAG TPA: YtxH domain-containing protein [Nitrolancea sp.]|nr:YtxH domain-containing protein [Nitrolancea sp.]
MGTTNHRGAFIFGVIVGAAGGALSALMMTPKSGQQIRDQIKGQTGGVQERLTTATSGVRERADVVIGASKEKVTQIKERVHETEDNVVELTKSGERVVNDVPTPINTGDITGAANAVEHQEHSASNPS